ncbi:hypothetical protein BJ508DRAFT_325168 [Ascobolus immersus RN42]|uniref:Uncharacterized protein n=1 Tax=Ascobolus immersus RN42 TaxID=1160509 RepID=A0A3N4IER0_ASCIM|nr:hypothetical protein BJ508DRAFT_325168 [Ascobolus immersus RN42]
MVRDADNHHPTLETRKEHHEQRKLELKMVHQEGIIYSSPSNTRRPPLFDRHMSRSSINENIVLGPPKLSFASANAQLSRKLDGEPSTPGAVPSHLEDERDVPYSPRSFDRFRTNRTNNEKNNDREFRPGFGRRGLRGEDGETWTSEKRQPRRSFGAEDGDRFRRDGDRENPRERSDRPERNDRNGHRDRDRGDRERDNGKDRARGFDNYNRDRDRDRPPMKKREEGSWLIRDGDNRDNRDSRDNRGDRDFSGRDRDRNDRDRDNGYGGRFSRVEKDPEWMHSTSDDKDDSKPARSIEELQRWKERRKAESAAAAGIPRKAETEQIKAPEPEPVVEKTKSEPPATLGLKSPDNGVDQFFSMWAPTPSILGTPAADPLASAGEATRPLATGRSSRFTSFFGQDQPISPQKTVSPAPTATPNTAPDRTGSATSHAPRTTNEDKEGFQRILQMLNGVGGKSPSVKSDTATSSAPLPTPRSQESQNPLQVRDRMAEPPVHRQRDEARRTPLSQASPGPSMPFSQLMDAGRHQSPDNGAGKEDQNDFIQRLMQSSQAQQRAKAQELEQQLHQTQLLQQQQQQKLIQQEQQQQQLLDQQRKEWVLQQQREQQLLAQQQQQEREREQRELERRRLQQQQLQLQQAQQSQQAPNAHLAQQLQQLQLAQQHSQGPQQNGQGQGRSGNQHSQLQAQTLLSTLQQQFQQQGPQSQAQLYQQQQALLQAHLHGQTQSQPNLHSLLQQHPNQLPQLQQSQQGRQSSQTHLPSLQHSLPNLHTGYGSSSGMPPPPALSSSPHSFSRGPPNNPLSPLYDDGPSGGFNRQRQNPDFNPMGRDAIAARELLVREQGTFRENGLGRDIGRDIGPQTPGAMQHLAGWPGQHAGHGQQPPQQQQQTAAQQQQQSSQQAGHQQANGAQSRGAVPPPPGFTGGQNGQSRPGPNAQSIPSLHGNPPYMGHPSQGPSGIPPPPSLPPFQLGHPGAPGGPPNGPNGPLPGNFPPPPFFGMTGPPPPHPNFPLSPYHNDAPVMGMGGPPPFPFPPDVKGLNLPQGMHPPPPQPSSRFFPS